MKYQNPKFDAIFGNNISATLRLLEKQERNMKKFSITESAASLAIKQITENNAALTAVNKTASSMASFLNPINELLKAQQSWNDKFQNVFSPVWEQMAMFSKFHEQTTHIGKILNPTISDYIQSNVRTNYAGAESVSAVEATYLETFEQLEDEIDIETLEEITEEIQNNPGWGEDLNKLRIAFHNSFLSNEFTVAITEIVNRRLKAQNPNVVVAIAAILYLLFTLWFSMEVESKE